MQDGAAAARRRSVGYVEADAMAHPAVLAGRKVLRAAHKSALLFAARHAFDSPVSGTIKMLERDNFARFRLTDAMALAAQAVTNARMEVTTTDSDNDGAVL